MTITKELSIYIAHWKATTGCQPSAIPVTAEELDRLRCEWADVMVKTIADPNSGIKIDEPLIVFRGCELYQHPDAPKIRHSIQ